MAKKKPAYIVTKEKVAKYKAKHPGASIREACNSLGLKVSNYSFNPVSRLKQEANRVKPVRTKVFKRKYKKRKEIIEPEVLKEATIVALVGTPSAISDTIGKIFN